MAKITIEAQTPGELIVFVRDWLNAESTSVQESPLSTGDADKVRAAVRRLNGKKARAILRDVAEAGKLGETVTVGDRLAQKHKVNDGGNLGGAISAAAFGLYKATGRWVMDRISTRPSVWKMSEADADVVLAALDEREAPLD